MMRSGNKENLKSQTGRRQWIALLMTPGLLFPSKAMAETVHVAVASNFVSTAKKIAEAFGEDTGHKIILSSGSTGKIYAQILKGAPYDIFLSADSKTVDRLQTKMSGRVTYALGKLVLLGSQRSILKETVSTSLNRSDLGKLAIANPKTAPYGRAAIETLTSLSMLEKLKTHFVTGENIAQTYQFVATGNASFGFVALSQVQNLNKTRFKIITRDLYSPIRQDAALLSRSADKPGARSFFSFLRSKVSKEIIRQSGYDLP